jgi:hypothetical protein
MITGAQDGPGSGVETHLHVTSTAGGEVTSAAGLQDGNGTVTRF